MNNSHWQLAWHIFEAARALPVSEQGRFVESQRAPAEVARRVVELLASPPEPDDLKPARTLCRTGTQVGRFVVGELLGRGGMGEVYAARDQDLHRPVALKFLLTEEIGDPSAVKRFVREARAASALNHPNILTVHEVIQTPPSVAIVMEHVEGAPLSDFRDTAHPLQQAIDLARQVAFALAAVHERGIVHRDIKPENLMLRPDGLVKVLDFGLAHRLAEPTVSTTAVSGGTIGGTLRYVSPEQLRDEPVTGASDIFSLGIVLYELTTGRHPFASTYAVETACAIHSRKPAPPSQVNPAIPKWLDQVILSMLAQAPASRPSARDLVAQLARPVEAGRTEVLRRWWHPAAGKQQPVVLAVLAFTVATVAVAPIVKPSEKNDTFDAPKLVQITTLPGLKDHPSVSPGGDRLAFSWRDLDQDALHLYVKSLEHGEPLQLTSSSESDVLPAWSPDGEQIAFCRRPTWYSGFDKQFREPAGIYIISARGGAERLVTTGWAGVSWSADGRQLAVARFPSGGEDSGGIDLFSITTGARRRLTSSYEDILPAFSPDGRWVAFTRVLAGTISPGGPREIFVVPASGGEARQLTFDGKYTGGATWTGDSRQVVFSSPRNRQLGELWRVPVEGGTPTPVSAGIRYAFSPSISRKGGRLVFREEWTDANIYLRSGSGLNGTRPGPFGERSAAVVSTREDHNPVISPDGKQVAFVSERSGNREIWIVPISGGRPVQLTSLGQEMLGAPGWSPDGREIAFHAGTPGHASLYVVSASGGKPSALLTGRSDSHNPAWSPDGEWVYFTSAISNRRELWKVRPAGGAALQITHGGAFEARPSPDGKTLFFSRGHETGCCAIWSVPAGGGTEDRVRGLEKFASISRSWGVLREGIYFITRSNDPLPTVRFLSFATDEVTDLVRLEKGPGWLFPGLAMTSDARRLLTVELDHSVNDLMLVENFR